MASGAHGNFDSKWKSCCSTGSEQEYGAGVVRESDCGDIEPPGDWLQRIVGD